MSVVLEGVQVRQHGAQIGPQRHQVLCRQRGGIVGRQVFDTSKFTHHRSPAGDQNGKLMRMLRVLVTANNELSRAPSEV
jgi:hypothetical protein